MSLCSPDNLAKAAGSTCSTNGSNPNKPYGFDHNYVVLKRKKDASKSAEADDDDDWS
jgi:hypothetical protein